MDDQLTTLSHVAHLSAILGVPTAVGSGDSGFLIPYLYHEPSNQPLAVLRIDPEGYCLVVNTADGQDDPAIWATLCTAMIYAVQNGIVCKMDDAGRLTELAEVK